MAIIRPIKPSASGKRQYDRNWAEIFPEQQAAQAVPVIYLDQFIQPDFPFEFDAFQPGCPIAQGKLPHRHAFYAIHYVTGGEGMQVIDFEPYPIRPDTLYFIAPGQIYFWRLSKPIEGDYVVFGAEFIALPASQFNQPHELAFFHTVAHSPELRLAPKDVAPLRDLLDAIGREYRGNSFNRVSVLRAYLHILLVQIQRLYLDAQPEAVTNPDAPVVRRFKQLVSEQFATTRNLEDYAAQIGVSASHLSNTVKALTGQPPGQIIRQEIVLEAKRLLAHTQLTAAEIGYRLNFDDPAYFARFFKREAGQSPTAFREQIQEKYQFFVK